MSRMRRTDFWVFQAEFYSEQISIAQGVACSFLNWANESDCGECRDSGALLSKKLFLNKNKAYNSVRKEQQSEKVTDQSRSEISTVPVPSSSSIRSVLSSSIHQVLSSSILSVLSSSIHSSPQFQYSFHPQFQYSFKSSVPVFVPVFSYSIYQVFSSITRFRPSSIQSRPSSIRFQFDFSFKSTHYLIRSPFQPFSTFFLFYFFFSLLVIFQINSA